MRRIGLIRLVQRLGIGFLILVLANVPLPVPEFRPIRQVDRKGAVSSLHDRLIDWRPDESSSDAGDLAIHWRWAPLGFGPVDAWGQDSGQEDVLGCELPDDPDLVPAIRTGFHFGLFRRSQDSAEWLSVADASRHASLSNSASLGGNFASTFPGRAPRDAMLQRWRC
jgi:hypothetical protein